MPLIAPNPGDGTDYSTLSTTMHSVTDRRTDGRTDGRHDDAKSRSYRRIHRQSPFSVTVAEFGDYNRQCGQGFSSPSVGQALNVAGCCFDPFSFHKAFVLSVRLLCCHSLKLSMADMDFACGRYGI